MSSFFDPKNPDSEAQLRNMFGQLPGMVNGMVKARNRPANGHSKGFTRFCPICSLLYERSKLWSTPELKEKHCKGCQKNLDEGFTALVTVSKRWAFVRHPKMPPGGTIRVSDKFMDAVEKAKKEGE